jgi:hypothetical protein
MLLEDFSELQNNLYKRIVFLAAFFHIQIKPQLFIQNNMHRMQTQPDSFTPLIAALLPLPEVTVLYDCNLVLFTCNFSRGFPTKFCTCFLYAASKLCICLFIISLYSTNLILNATLQGKSIHPNNIELGRYMWKAVWLLTTHTSV